MIIMIDPGHGGEPGAIGPSGVQEKDINLLVAERLHLLLADAGIEAYMTRIGDVGHCAGVVTHPIDNASCSEEVNRFP